MYLGTRGKSQSRLSGGGGRTLAVLRLTAFAYRACVCDASFLGLYISMLFPQGAVTSFPLKGRLTGAGHVSF